MHFDDLIGSRFEPGTEPGVRVVRLELREEHHGTHGFVHGGVVCTLAHESAGAAAYSLCRDGQVKASWSGSLESRSTVVRHGGRTSLVDTRIVGDDGELRATATSTFLILTRALQPPTAS
jgi:acyl-coenzyme A thioesterase PaaI-like protein